MYGFVYYQAEIHCVRQLWTKLKLQMNLKVELYQNYNVLLINNWIVYFFSYLLISSLIFYWFATKNKDLACFMPNNVLVMKKLHAYDWLKTSLFSCYTSAKS